MGGDPDGDRLVHPELTGDVPGAQVRGASDQHDQETADPDGLGNRERPVRNAQPAAVRIAVPGSGDGRHQVLAPCSAQSWKKYIGAIVDERVVGAVVLPGDDRLRERQQTARASVSRSWKIVFGQVVDGCPLRADRHSRGIRRGRRLDPKRAHVEIPGDHRHLEALRHDRPARRARGRRRRRARSAPRDPRAGAPGTAASGACAGS